MRKAVFHSRRERDVFTRSSGESSDSNRLKVRGGVRQFKFGIEHDSTDGTIALGPRMIWERCLRLQVLPAQRLPATRQCHALSLVQTLVFSPSRSSLSFAKSLAGFKISKIREHRVTCYMDEFRLGLFKGLLEFLAGDGARNYCGP